jgi:hypothetical protein
MRSGVAGASYFGGFRRGGAPHNREAERDRLDVDGEGADRAGEGAVVAAVEDADLSHCRLS